MTRLVMLCGAVLPCLWGCSGPASDLAVVNSVDLERYMGRWYEIASYPAFFQRGCVGSTADYTLNDDGTVTVINRCFDESLDGDLREARGTARVVDAGSNAKLKVRFFLFDGDYWILEVGDQLDYGHAVVGTPNRDYLWILSRTPAMDETLFDDILGRVSELGFDPARLQRTEQP